MHRQTIHYGIHRSLIPIPILRPIFPLSLPVGLSRGKVDTLFYLDRFLLRSVWEIAAEPSEYRAPHQDFGSCREIGVKTHWGSIRSHFSARPAPRPADAKVTVAECTCTVYGTRVCLRVQLCVLSFTRSIGTVYYGTAVVDPVQLYRFTVHSISVDLLYRELILYCTSIYTLYLYYSINGSCDGSSIDRSCARFAAAPHDSLGADHLWAHPPLAVSDL